MSIRSSKHRSKQLDSVINVLSLLFHPFVYIFQNLNTQIPSSVSHISFDPEMAWGIRTLALINKPANFKYVS